MWFIILTLENILETWNCFLVNNFFSYVVTSNKLIKYAFVNKDETFVFSLYLILPKFDFSNWLFCGLDGLLQLDYN